MTDKQQGYNISDTMRELIRDNIMLLPVISRFDIPFGFGDSPIGEICRQNSVDADTFLCVCNLLSGYKYDASSISLHSLMGYLKRAHTSFLEIELPRIRHNMIDAINNWSADEAALLLIRFYDDYVIEVRKHMECENNIIFEYVNRLLRGETDENFNISHYSTSHADTATKLKELKDIFIYHYKQQDSARLSRVLFDIIMCERDMMSHFEVESRLFVPEVEKLERSLSKSKTSLATASGIDGPDTESRRPLSELSEREIEIIRSLAQGKGNKQIADELCISVHTVATHRRNISAKLEIHTAAGLTVFAIMHHLVDINDVKPI